MEERKRDVLQALVEYLKYLEFFYQTSHLQNWMDGAATIFSIIFKKALSYANFILSRSTFFSPPSPKS